MQLAMITAQQVAVLFLLIFTGAAATKAGILRSEGKHRQDQRSRKRIQAGKDAAFEEQHAVSQEERQDGASQICPTDLSKDQDQGHTDQTCSKGSRHDLRTAMKKHLRSQSRQAGRQSSDQGNAGTVYSQKDCKHAGQKQLCPQKPWHGNRDRHDIFQRIMGRLPVHEPGACHHQ